MKNERMAKCKCGKTKDANGNCDGSHANSTKLIKKLGLGFVVLLIGLTFQSFTSIKKDVINVASSSIEWKGEKVVGSHQGLISLQSGELVYDGKQLVGGSFIIDMKSLTCTDLTGEYKSKLEGHLKSDDFFGVNKFETASLSITKVTKIKSKSHSISADLTIKGITKTINFEAEVDKNNLSANIKIDRTEFGVRYGSGNFFDGLGDNMIFDEFELIVNLFI
jgi:polyisoprenoid-binding protein YceI